MSGETIKTRYVKSSDTARRLGVTTKTLAKWRYEKKGPKGWIYASPTMTLYPDHEVDAFIQKRTETIPTFNFRRPVTMK